jgi:hypothetical protein
MDKPYTVEKVKSVVGRITGYVVKQGDRQWNGKTAQEAAALREADILQACQDRHDPIVISNGEDTWIGCYSFPHGWMYGRVRKRHTNGEHQVYGSGQYKTRRECERHMRGTVAAQSYKLGDGPDFAVLDDACQYLRSSSCEPEDIAEHLVSLAWQRGAKIAKAQGYEVCVSPNSPGDKIADDVKRTEADRVYGLLRKHKTNYVWQPHFDIVDYLRGAK